MRISDWSSDVCSSDLLQPPGGEEPPLPVAAKAQPTFEEMTTLPPQAEPDRVNDPLPRSQPRPDDRFEMPPPGKGQEIMDHFDYRDGVLHGEDVALPDIADAIGTQFYCYSPPTITRHFRVLR